MLGQIIKVKVNVLDDFCLYHCGNHEFAVVNVLAKNEDLMLLDLYDLETGERNNLALFENEFSVLD